ncbi:hypothetical protein PV10_05065 [Exophiala mesophila]|uniref:MoaB/Mog domain-containing protein n=1 Tax=Exophiala mesophila TaxID=212818 RepID=A0A0D1Y048_EXOME|nr:uncharacterized protein PV10_05065 [Exophiala mesophila]KIV93886.1 hypothetical protein PV10_05065 [Exophiala mesophila]
MSQAPPLRPAILIVSDTAFADPSTDKAGSALTETFSVDGAGRWEEPIIEIVKDDVLEIQRAVRSWSDGESQASGPINLIVTTGGTGFARRDFTPEAISPLIHRHAPGIVHGMLAASFQVTPFAMMSRPVAGVRNKSIIVTLPGSPKGAKENLQAILKLLPHACMQAAGEDSRQAHAGGVSKLEKDAGVSSSTAKPAVGGGSHSHSHHHHHHDHDHGHGHGGHKVPKAHTDPSQRPHQSNDPRLGATARARSSPYPMLSVEEAVAKIIEQSPSPIVEIRDVSPDLVGYVLAEDIKAAEAVPAYRASIVDGYAVIVPSESDQTSSTSAVTSIKGVFPVASVSHAQAASLPPPLQPGQIARITTGAPLPENANAVVMVEDTTIASLTDDQSEEATVEILTSELAIGENIREPGSDIQLSEVVLTKGTSISRFGGEVGVLAAAGIAQVPVYRKARIGILSTGDEVTDVSNTTTKSQPLTNGMIRDSNRPSLLTLVGQWPVTGAVVDLGIARDTPNTALEEALRAGYRDHDLDIIVTTGGVSMGELDLLKPTVERSLGGTVHFGRVSMKPGKPTTFASIPFKPSSALTSSRESRLLFGLPGNPASALVTANLFLLPCIQHIGGYGGGSIAAKGLERVTVTVDSRIRCDPTRVEYHRVRVRFVGTGSGQQQGRLVASSTGMQRSSRVASLASANALLQLPLREGYLEKGDECVALLLASP